MSASLPADMLTDANSLVRVVMNNSSKKVNGRAGRTQRTPGIKATPTGQVNFARLFAIINPTWKSWRKKSRSSSGNT